MRIFLDTEFIEDGKTIDLISIALVAEDGRELYLGNRECEFHKCSPWVRDNVLKPMGFDFIKNKCSEPMVPIDPTFWISKAGIAQRVSDFFREGDEFWAYYADYDWIAICQLYGSMMDLPNHFPMFCLDIKQMAHVKGIKDLPQQESGEHNALEDARHNKYLYNWLTDRY